MSEAPSILCPICTENFQTSDTIYNTSCGHVFHHNCIQDWRGRSTECPVCRARYANMQKVFLNFDEKAGGETVKNELQAKLESYKTGNEKLSDQLNETEFCLLDMQERYTLALEEINLLKGQLSKRNDSENNFMALQKQYTEAEDIIKNLKDKNQYLLLQCEGKNKEIQLKTLEISTLKDTMGCMETSVGGSESILKQQLKIMEQKLTHITGELQKEISISMQLSIDKMRLQSLVDQYGATKTEPSPNFVNNIQKQRPIEKENEKLTEKETTTKDSTHLTSVVIKRFPSHHIRYPLIDMVIALASAIQVQLSACDICDVRILQHRNEKHDLPNLVSERAVNKSVVDGLSTVMPNTNFCDNGSPVASTSAVNISCTKSNINLSSTGTNENKTGSIFATSNLNQMNNITINSQKSPLGTLHTTPANNEKLSNISFAFPHFPPKCSTVVASNTTNSVIHSNSVFMNGKRASADCMTGASVTANTVIASIRDRTVIASSTTDTGIEWPNNAFIFGSEENTENINENPRATFGSFPFFGPTGCTLTKAENLTDHFVKLKINSNKSKVPEQRPVRRVDRKPKKNPFRDLSTRCLKSGFSGTDTPLILQNQLRMESKKADAHGNRNCKDH